MYKAVSCWSPPSPEDLEAFEEHYWNVHVPLAEKIPGTQKLVLTRTEDGMEAPPAFYRVAEMGFADRDAFERATQTDEWRELRKDAAGMHERFGVSLDTGLGYERDSDLQS